MNFSGAHPETSTAPLLERDAEVERAQELLARARAGGGGVVAFEGPPGIGKTRLMGELRARAAADGMRVLSATGAELESRFGFGVVRQLFEPVVVGAGDELRAALFDGAAHAAEPAVGIAGEGAEGESDSDSDERRYAVVHGLYWLTANLAAAEGPLLIAVDDLQWADEPSLRFLAYLVRRVAGLEVAVAVAFRPAVPGSERPVIDAIAGAGEGGAPLILTPLGRDAVATLAAERLGAGVDDDFVSACREATGGNALLIEELLADLLERGDAPTAAAVRAEQIGVDRVARRVRRHLAALPPGAAALAGAVAVTGDGWPPDVGGSVAGLDAAVTLATAASLVAADVFAEGTTLRFRHPLVRAAVVETLPDLERATAHRRAAAALADRGAAWSAVATHLLEAPPAGDAWVVDALRRAAREAVDQGTPELAFTYLRRALDEPAGESVRADVLAHAGRAALTAGDTRAPQYLADAMDAAGDPVDRARISIELAVSHTVGTRWRESHAVALRGLEGLGDADRELELVLRALVADAERMDRTIGGDAPQRLVELARSLEGATPAERLVKALGRMMFSSDTADEHAEVAHLAARLTHDDIQMSFTSDTGIASNLIRASRLDEAATFIDERLRLAASRGLLRTHSTMTFFRAWVAWVRGDLAGANEDLVTTLQAAAEVDAPRPPVVTLLALVVAARGRAGEVDSLLAADGLDGPLPASQVFNLSLFHRAQARGFQRRFDDALADALEVGRRYEAYGIERAVPPWRSFAAKLLAARGEVDRAVSLAEEELTLARQWGTDLAVGLAQHGLGVVRDDVAVLAEGVDALARSPARLDLALARLDLGAALRRANRRADAREPLRLAMDEAFACGAEPVAERAREELRATGARPRNLALSGVEALTPSERRVARLAAEGMTNRHIAQELFVTTATVETHLRHVFQKLEIASREELPANLMVGP